jgi:hypothetical protein
MKLEKFLDLNIVTGVVFGLLIGLHYPSIEAYKGLLVILGVVMGLKVVGLVK